MNSPLASFVDTSGLIIGDVTGAGDAVIRVCAAAVAGEIEYFFATRVFAN
jgi:bifunctional ADP-heptose synthase (sugar kinase/adenylyltransferase)